jgi:hypothetical protein
MNEHLDDQPPTAVLQQADLLANQLQGDAVPEVNAAEEVLAAANLNIVAPQFVSPVAEPTTNPDIVAPRSSSAAHDVLDQGSSDAVDVLMEYQLEDNMLIQQHDCEQENTERALTLFVPPITQ